MSPLTCFFKPAFHRLTKDRNRGVETPEEFSRESVKSKRPSEKGASNPV